MRTTWPPPKKSAIQIKTTPKGTLKVRCRHGWEVADTVKFALILHDAAWNHRP